MKTFIFDLDGTMANTIYDITGALNYALSRRGMPLCTEEQAVVFVGHGLDDFIKNMVPSLRGDEAAFTAFRQDYFDFYSAHYMDRTVPYPGMRELASELKRRGCLTVLASNKTDAYVRDFAATMFAGCFDMAIGQREGVPPKPSKELGDYILNRLKIKSCDCIMVGDSKYDILFARNCGFYAAAVDWGFSQPGELADAKPDAVFSRAEDILTLA